MSTVGWVTVALVVWIVLLLAAAWAIANVGGQVEEGRRR